MYEAPVGHDPKTASNEYLAAMTHKLGANELAYMVPSTISDSHFSEESSEVESYHQSKLR